MSFGKRSDLEAVWGSVWLSASVHLLPACIYCGPQWCKLLKWSTHCERRAVAFSTRNRFCWRGFHPTLAASSSGNLSFPFQASFFRRCNYTDLTFNPTIVCKWLCLVVSFKDLTVAGSVVGVWQMVALSQSAGFSRAWGKRCSCRSIRYVQCTEGAHVVYSGSSAVRHHDVTTRWQLLTNHCSAYLPVHRWGEAVLTTQCFDHIRIVALAALIAVYLLGHRTVHSKTLSSPLGLPKHCRIVQLVVKKSRRPCLGP